jgi:hypothetical protein
MITPCSSTRQVTALSRDEVCQHPMQRNPPRVSAVQCLPAEDTHSLAAYGDCLADRPGLLPSTAPSLRWNRALSLTARTARLHEARITPLGPINYRIYRYPRSQAMSGSLGSRPGADAVESR